MRQEKYFPPTFKKRQFHCPHSNCEVYSKQYWSHLAVHRMHVGTLSGLSDFSENLNREWIISKCDHCRQYIIWYKGKIIFPKIIPVSNPNEDLTDEIKSDYLEAAMIFNDSPKASAALIRLALQKLMIQLDEKGKNIFDDIGKLVKKGLNPNIQKSLDILRITGNNAVHPGEINLEDEPEKVLKLFDLVNIIAEKMISEPKEIDSLYEDLPEKAKEAVKKRDSK